MSDASKRGTASSFGPWHPLRIGIFRNLLIADLVSDIGTFMRTVGAAWLMTTLTNRTVRYVIDPAKAPEFLKDVYRYERIRRRKEGVTWVTVDCDCGHSRPPSPRPLWVCSTGNGGGSA